MSRHFSAWGLVVVLKSFGGGPGQLKAVAEQGHVLRLAALGVDVEAYIYYAMRLLS
jgi:hypothetical protein